MLTSILVVVIGLGLIYLALDKLESWKPANIIFTFFGGAVLTLAGAGSIVLPPIISFIKKVAHVE